MKKALGNARKPANLVSSFLIWSLAVSLILILGNVITADVIPENDASGGSSSDNENDVLFFDWKPSLGAVVGDTGTKWASAPSSSSTAEQPYQENSLNQFIFAKKRAVFGIMGLATKRPHKTAAQIQHLPPQDAFMSVRGKKSPSFPVTPIKIQPMLLPGYSY